VNPGEIHDKLQRVLTRSGLTKSAGVASS